MLKPAPAHRAAVHLDLDGARHVFQAHGWRYRAGDDPLFESGLQGALELFARTGTSATLFVIAEDVLDRGKLPLLQAAVAAGHEIGSHSVTHGRLTNMDLAAKRREIRESRDMLQSALGVEVLGFRAPGFHSDAQCLELINDAGYAYDSSELAGHGNGAGTPYRPLRDQALVELPVPAITPFSLPFHPSYSLVVGQWIFNAGLARHRRGGAPFVLLFHLTDFAEPLHETRRPHWQQTLYTLSHLSMAHKRERCAAMLKSVQDEFEVGPTARLLETVERGVDAASVTAS
jgi:peptidoglycan/xylan/chitin deacetylase (PgdA/CDA1 family)